MSYKFSDKSKKRLETCHPYLQLLMTKVLEHLDITIIEGHRNKEKQNNYYYAIPPKSKVKYPNSKHNKIPSMAVDIAIYHKNEPHIRWSTIKEWYYLAGIVEGRAKALGIEIRWGGDWDQDGDFNDQDFNDLVHFELIL
jgi:peptidoglycan L-alanyl-D-glutamate endopeptidase CwlK